MGIVEKVEYKTVTINSNGGVIKFNAEKFDNDCMEQINKIAHELGIDGWELLNVFSVSLTLVFKRKGEI